MRRETLVKTYSYAAISEKHRNISNAYFVWFEGRFLLRTRDK